MYDLLLPKVVHNPKFGAYHLSLKPPMTELIKSIDGSNWPANDFVR